MIFKRVISLIHATNCYWKLILALLFIKKFPTLITLKRHTAGPYIEAGDSILNLYTILTVHFILIIISSFHVEAWYVSSLPCVRQVTLSSFSLILFLFVHYLFSFLLLFILLLIFSDTVYYLR